MIMRHGVPERLSQNLGIEQGTGPKGRQAGINYWVKRALKARHTLLCRTFGAYFTNKTIPGLMAGPTDWRSFGPDFKF
jgi:hypothetical protein